MFEDGLRYQDARMASEDEMKRDLYGFHINDSRLDTQGRSDSFQGIGPWPMLIRVRCTVLLWEIQAP